MGMAPDRGESATDAREGLRAGDRIAAGGALLHLLRQRRREARRAAEGRHRSRPDRIPVLRASRRISNRGSRRLRADGHAHLTPTQNYRRIARRPKMKAAAPATTHARFLFSSRWMLREVAS